MYTHSQKDTHRQTHTPAFTQTDNHSHTDNHTVTHNHTDTHIHIQTYLDIVSHQYTITQGTHIQACHTHTEDTVIYRLPDTLNMHTLTFTPKYTIDALLTWASSMLTFSCRSSILLSCSFKLFFKATI